MSTTNNLEELSSEDDDQEVILPMKAKTVDKKIILPPVLKDKYGINQYIGLWELYWDRGEKSAGIPPNIYMPLSESDYAYFWKNDTKLIRKGIKEIQHYLNGIPFNKKSLDYLHWLVKEFYIKKNKYETESSKLFPNKTRKDISRRIYESAGAVLANYIVRRYPRTYIRNFIEVSLVNAKKLGFKNEKEIVNLLEDLKYFRPIEMGRLIHNSQRFCIFWKSFTIEYSPLTFEFQKKKMKLICYKTI